MLKDHPRLRLAIYLASIVLGAAAPIIAVIAPEYGTAIATSAGILGAAAGVVAASNVTP